MRPVGSKDVAPMIRRSGVRAAVRWAREQLKDKDIKAVFPELKGKRLADLRDVEALEVAWYVMMENDMSDAMRTLSRFLPPQLLLEIDDDQTPMILSHKPLEESEWLEEYGNPAEPH